MKIKKGDNVIVTAGKDKGKKGKIMKTFPSLNRVLVEGINMKKKHVKPRGGTKGSTIELAMPMHASNVMLIDPKSGKATRTGFKTVGDKKVRIARKSGQEI
jgi:large subunit ribosomal protein L24